MESLINPLKIIGDAGTNTGTEIILSQVQMFFHQQNFDFKILEHRFERVSF